MLTGRRKRCQSRCSLGEHAVTALFATLLALAFLSLAQSAPSAYGQARANQMIIALDPDWATFDPAHSYESTGQMVLKGVYEGLVRIHPVTRDFEPLLAREWTVSDDGRTFTFHLNPDAAFAFGPSGHRGRRGVFHQPLEAPAREPVVYGRQHRGRRSRG